MIRSFIVKRTYEVTFDDSCVDNGEDVKQVAVEAIDEPWKGSKSTITGEEVTEICGNKAGQDE